MTANGTRGGAFSAKVPQLLSRTVGPLLRIRRQGSSSFLDRPGGTHTEAILALPDDHRERSIHALGLTGCRAILDVGCGSGAFWRKWRD